VTRSTILNSFLAFFATISIFSNLVGFNSANSQTQFNSNANPIQIEADNGIEWLSKEKIYIARGKATARQGNLNIKCDILKAFYRESKTKDAEVYRLEAIGNVVIKNSDKTAYGDHGIYDLDKSVMLLEGSDLRLRTPLEIVKASESLEYWDKKQLAIARGNAEATRGKRKISANILTMYFLKNKTTALEADRIDAIGRVTISTPNEIATGDEAIYMVQKGIVTLSGNVKVTRGKSQLNGSIAEVNLNTGRSRLLSKKELDGNSKVQGLFTRNLNQSK
jgi:lipopolysaccharide export system protein LptA